MTTLTTIINAAFRESGITAIGTTPDANESAEAVSILVNYISSLFFNEIGEHLTPYNVGSNGVTYGPSYDQTISTVVKGNSQLLCNLSGATTLYLPPMPENGSLIIVSDVAGNFGTNPLTLKGNGRMINSSATMVFNTNSSTTPLIYTPWIGAGGPPTTVGWNTLALPLVASDSSPFNSKYDDMLVIALAMRINPRYGADTHPESIQVFNRLYKQFKRDFNHSEEVASERGITRLSSNPYSHVWDFNSFNLGR